MKKWKRGLKKGLAYLLIFSMVLSMSGVPTLTVNASEGITVSNSCEHHTEHNEDCGYIEATEGSPCTHEHDDSCYAEEAGGETKTLNCQHTHDENCGYVEAVEGHPCAFACTDCVDEPKEEENVCTCEVQCEEDSVNSECPVCSVEGADLSACAGEEGDECTCGTDDASIHATNCPAYVAPENPECFCAEKCTEETVNVWCDVCGFDYTACKGEDTATVYETTCEHATIVNNICSACGKYGYCGVSGSEGSVTWEITGEENNYTLTISGEGDMADYEVVQINGEWVESTPWYSYYDRITKAVVEEGVTRIGNDAFAMGAKIEDVSLANSVITIGDWAFADCYGLKSIIIPDSVTTIGVGAFMNCKSLLSIHLPPSLKRVEANLVQACEKLTEVTIPSNVETIGDAAFDGCVSLEYLEIPASVKIIETNSCYFDTGAITLTIRYLGTTDPVSGDRCGATTVYVPCTYTSDTFGGVTVTKEHNLDETTGICTYCLGHCGAEGNEDKVIWAFDESTGTLTISGTGAMADYEEEIPVGDVKRTSAPWGVYYDRITKLVVENGVTSIGLGAFDECYLVDVSLPDSLIEIGEYAFYDCYSIESIIIPDSVTTIGRGAFQDCRSLLSIHLPSSLKRMESSVIRCCEKLTEVIIPNGVGYIGELNFDECTSLEYLEIPSSVNTIYACTLGASTATLTIRYFGKTEPHFDPSYCDAQTVYVPCTYEGDTFGGKTVTKEHNLDEDGICTYCLGHCGATGNEENVIWSFKDGTLTISGSGAMADYSVVTIGDDAQQTSAPWGVYTDNLKKVIVKEGITSIGSFAFCWCQMIEEVEFANSIEKIGQYAFYLCNQLTEVKLPANLEEIEIWAFNRCHSLESIEWNTNLETIGRYGFAYCYGLESIVLPSSVTTIGEYAFDMSGADVPQLEYVEIPASVTSMGNCAFYSEVLKSVYFLGESKPTGIHASAIKINDEMNITVFVPCTYSSDDSTFGGAPVVKDHFDTNGDSTLTYEVETSKDIIIEKCSACDHTATATLTVENDLTYNGTDQASKVSVEYSEDWSGDKPEATVSPATVINAGNYTASVTYEGVTATKDFTIAKATPDIGDVSVTPNELTDSTDITELALARTNDTVAGTLTFAEGSKLRYGINDLSWVFTPTGEDANNYTVLTSDDNNKVSVTVKDTQEPTFEYQIEENKWKEFVNTVTLGLFCKDFVEVKIQCTDELSGIQTFEYYISSTGAVEDTNNITWTEYTFGENAERSSAEVTKSLNGRGDYVIYLRATDVANNEIGILSIEQIIVFNDSVADENADIEITYGSDTDKTTKVELNGNTVKDITLDGTSIGADNYSVAEDGTITIKGDYLKTLDANATGYTFTVSYYPMGVTGVATLMTSGDEISPADTTFKVVVKPQTITATVSAEDKKYYDGNTDATVSVTSFDGLVNSETLEEGTDYTIEGKFENADAGENKKVTITVSILNPNYTFADGTEEEFEATASIGKANVEITLSQASYEKTYGDGVFDLGVEENNTDENGKVTYTSSNASVVTVDANGKVTIKGAGEATITVTLAETTNYNAAESKSITVKVAKKAYSVDTINKKYLNTRDNANSIDLSALLPRDCGKVEFETPQTTGAMSYKVTPSIADEILSYTVASGDVGTTGTITVTVSTQNYEDITITVNVELIDQIPVELQEGSSVTLNNSVLTYGEALSELAFNTAVFVDEDGNTVAGTLAWKEPATTPNAGTTSATWVFTPSNEEYASLEGTVAITVKKATPNLSALPEAADTVYNPNAKLSQISLSEGTVSVKGKWEWQTGDIAPTVNNKGYVAVFKPTDNTNYEELMRTIAVTVTPATPVITNVSGLAITYGDTLSTSTLSGAAQYSSADSTEVTGNFAWKDGTVKPTVADSNQTAYTVVFTPSDKVNYNKVETTITITVNKAENAPNMPGATMSVSNKYTKIGDVPLPTGWEWQDADKEKALEVDTPVTATAVYVGTDKGNYEKEKVLITVTRSACDHVAGEILYTGEGEKAPTCTESGLGHKECSKCQTVMESGIVVKALGHTGGTATCKDKAVCTRCKQPYGSTDGSKHGDTELRGYKEATCTSGGYTGDTHCKDCGAKLASGTATAATGHNYSSEVTKQPTTTEEGVRTYTCANCKDTYTEAIPKLPDEEHEHSYTSTITREATCSQTGIKTYTCKCGDSYTETIAKLDHNYTSKVTVEATTDKEGEMTYTCSLCGHSYTEPIAKLTEGSSDAGEAPFIEGDDGKMGWEVISDEINEATDGDTVVVDMNGSTIVPGDIFEQIKGKDITVTFKLDNGLSWTVNGKTVTADEIGDIDFGVTLGSDEAPLNKIPVDVINNVTGERYSMELTLAYDGEFGFEAVLSVEMDAKNEGLYANLFYYNPNTNETEYICADVIDEKGIAELTFTHASDYLIVIDDVDMGIEDTMGDATDDTTDVEAPKTDDNAWRFVWIIVLGAIVLVVGGIIFFVVAKRRKEEE